MKIPLSSSDVHNATQPVTLTWQQLLFRTAGLKWFNLIWALRAQNYSCPAQRSQNASTVLKSRLNAKGDFAKVQCQSFKIKAPDRLVLPSARGSVFVKQSWNERLQHFCFFVVLHKVDGRLSSDTQKHSYTTSYQSIHSPGASSSSFSDAGMMWRLLRLHGFHRPALQVLHVVLVLLFLGRSGR